MSTSRFRITAAALAMLPVLALGHVAWSQQEEDPQPAASQDGQAQEGQSQAAQAARRQQAQRGQAQFGRQQGGQLDHLLVAWLEIGNEGEIAMSEFAQEKAQSDEVKQFAQQMIEEHQQFVQQLQQASSGAGSLGQQEPTNESPQNRLNAQGKENRPEAAAQAKEGRQPFNPAVGSSKAGGMDSQLIQLKRQIGQQHVATLQRELEEKSPEEFDRCYLGQQVMAHLEMLDTLKVFQEQASPELKDTLAQGEQTTQQHLEHAKQLLKEQEGGAAGTARRPAARQPRQK